MNEYYLWETDNPICNGCYEGHHTEHKKEIWWVDEEANSAIRRCECRECHNAV